MSESVQVFIRCRPLNKKELAMKSPSIVECLSNQVQLKGKSFAFDQVFGVDSSQSEVFQSVKHVIDAVIDGYNGCLFCYGQTGTGKTFTMQGIAEIPDLRGIIPNTFDYIFKRISESNAKFLLRCSFLEIYNEDIHDLLIKGKPNLDLKEYPDKTVYVKDLTNIVVHSMADMQNIMKIGNEVRSVAATQMNDESSRSHCVFTITIEHLMDNQTVRVGKLNLVDLAGSERQSKTGATGDRLKEGAKINLSLSNLGNVISSLVENKPHIPYRDSKLTRLLQDALGGNSKTVMISTISPADYNADESISTLRYASRAKNIKNKPKINEDPKDTKIREYQEEIKRIKKMLENKIKPETLKGEEAEQISDDQLKMSEEETIQLAKKLEELRSSILQKPKPEVVVKDSKRIQQAVAYLDDQNKKNETLSLELQKAENDKAIFESKYTSLAEQVKDYRKKLKEMEKEKEELRMKIEKYKLDYEIRIANSRKVQSEILKDLQFKQKLLKSLPKEYLEFHEKRIASKKSLLEYHRENPIKTRKADTPKISKAKIFENTQNRIKQYMLHGKVPDFDFDAMDTLYVHLAPPTTKSEPLPPSSDDFRK
eukprot:NODE_7_length_67686_cov_1.621421.p7 type:complete len:596 gc:universal NODE_7_length_67686_cov_1.621421:62567-60780(-)